MYSFKLDCKPFSVNAYHYRDKRHKTVEAKAWEQTVSTQLLENKELQELAEDWRKCGGYFILDFHAFYPAHTFYTQNQEISGRTIDVTNYEKPLQDLIFAQMGLNDKLVKKLISEKSVGAYNYIEVKITHVIP